jgi:hypothetical protein
VERYVLAAVERRIDLLLPDERLGDEPDADGGEGNADHFVRHAVPPVSSGTRRPAPKLTAKLVRPVRHQAR